MPVGGAFALDLHHDAGVGTEPPPRPRVSCARKKYSMWLQGEEAVGDDLGALLGGPVTSCTGVARM
jgi:hypothetical protein